MLLGYCLDTFIYLQELTRVCASGAKIALVVGDVRYGGAPVVVDEIVWEIAEQAGLASDGSNRGCAASRKQRTADGKARPDAISGKHRRAHDAVNGSAFPRL